MTRESKKLEDLQFDDTQSTNANGGVVIGHLSGPVADIVNTTRNGRKYSEELWDKVFKDPITKEYFNCGGIFGELGHPLDREETDMSKIALCMPKAPEKKNGKLWATFDILDTPNGRILKTLCQYGYKMGISSRGSGDIITDYDGQESVDPDTYQFNAFDAVLLPAVKEARLNFTESLNTNKSFKKALTESLNSASDTDRAIMEETLSNLNININESSCLGEDCEYMVCIPISQEGNWMNMISPVDIELHGIYATQNGEDFADFEHLYPIEGACEVCEDFIKIPCTLDNKELCESILQEGDSWRVAFTLVDKDTGEELRSSFRSIEMAKAYLARYTDKTISDYIVYYERYKNGHFFDKTKVKVNESISEETLDIEEGCKDVGNAETLVNDLQEALKENAQLEAKIAELQEKLSVCYAKEAGLNESLSISKSNVAKLAENAKKVDALETKVSRLTESLEENGKKLERSVSNRKALQEKLNHSVKEAKSLKEKVGVLQKENANLIEENNTLTESVTNLQKDIELKKSEYSKKLNESKAIAEKKAKIANRAVEKYIESQATRIGVSPNEIKNKLSESYTFDDIDQICEDLQSYQLNMSKLPFNTSIKENLKMKATSSQKEYIKPANAFSDDVDNDLLQLAGL